MGKVLLHQCCSPGVGVKIKLQDQQNMLTLESVKLGEIKSWTDPLLHWLWKRYWTRL